MGLRRIGIWVVVVLLGLFVANVVISAVFTALSMLWSLVYTATIIAILGGLLYGAIKLFGMASRDGERSSFGTDNADFERPGRTTTEPSRNSDDRIDELRDQYANGDISESELERELERELETDSLERELERDRL